VALTIEYYEAALKLDAVTFDGSREEAIRAAKAGLQAEDRATHARILDEKGEVIGLVHPK
jgi:hypothetical protein